MRRLSVLDLGLCLFGLTLLATSRAAVAGDAVTYVKDIKPVLDRHCVSCHRGIFDLSVFPFKGGSAPTQEGVVELMIERMRRGRDDWKRMPPPRVASEPLATATIKMFERWLAAGLPVRQ